MVAAALLLGACTGGDEPGAVVPSLLTPSPVPFDPAELEQRFVDRVNEERRARGQRPLEVAPDLRAFARRHSREMRDAGAIFHSRRRERNQIRGPIVGENVGTGSTVGQIHEAFMDSRSHRANILLKGYTNIGVGVVVANTGIFVTQVFARRARG